jgi:tetratricopeptide (TPR) repeat protein
MTKRVLMPILVSLLALVSVSWLEAQNSGTVKGVCKDVNGKPIAGAQVEWLNTENGRKYELKTNNKGEYFSLGIVPGKYKVTLSSGSQELFHFGGVNVSLDETELDFDLKKEQTATAQAAGITPEQMKAREEQQEKASKENLNVKTLNDKLALAKQDADQGKFNDAITTMTEATQMDPNRDLLWAKLGDYEESAGANTKDSAEKSKDYGEAVTDYEKAVDLKQKALDAEPSKKTPEEIKKLASYYNNLGQAQAKAGKTDDAVKSYAQAMQVDPGGAAQYYFNTGAVLTNANRSDDAIAAFDKSIAADPNRADAYYQKGVNLMSKATLKGDKMVAPDGTAQAFNKYLELQPNGQFADVAKQMLESIGATIETQYGNKKKPAK